MTQTIRVSKSGFNALTDANIYDYSLYADSDNILIKEHSRGSGNGNTTITHDLGYIPTFFVYCGTALQSNYGESNWVDQSAWVYAKAATWGVSQSFQSSGGKLLSAKFYVKKSGSPTGNAYAKLYTHSGTFGSSSIPTSTALATSDAFDVSTLTGTHQLITFNFTGANQYQMIAGTYYCISIEYFDSGVQDNRIEVGKDTTSPSHVGNESELTGDPGTWTAAAGSDAIFYVYASDRFRIVNAQNPLGGGSQVYATTTTLVIANNDNQDYQYYIFYDDMD